MGAAACSSGDDDGTASSTSAAAGEASPTTAAPTYEGDPGSEFCTLLREVDTDEILAGDGDDPVAVEEAMGRLVDVLTQAAATAPAEILDDVALVAGGVQSLDEALAAAGYSFDALAASGQAEEVQAAVNDPAFTDAGTRLAAYRGQVCGL